VTTGRYQVRILRRAEDDLRELHSYVSREAPRTAARLLETLLLAIESLAEMPLRGAVPRDPALAQRGFRFLPVGQHLVFYKVLRRQVRVHRVLRGRRAWQGLL